MLGTHRPAIQTVNCYSYIPALALRSHSRHRATDENHPTSSMGASLQAKKTSPLRSLRSQVHPERSELSTLGLRRWHGRRVLKISFDSGLHETALHSETMQHFLSELLVL